MKPEKIIIHCSATPNGKSVDISEIKKWHLARGFIDIGYHVVIDVDGTVKYGRPLDQQGAHVEGHNDGSIGICLVGLNKYSREQFKSLREELDRIKIAHSIPDWEVWCHNQFDTAVLQGKTCPNMEINKIVLWYVLHEDDAIRSYILP